MPPLTPSRSKSRNRSGVRGFLSRSWATLKRLCGTRKAKHEPECRTVRSGNKNLTVNVRNRVPILQRLMAREANTPEYRRVLRTLRNQNAPSPIRLPAISNQNFFRPLPTTPVQRMPAYTSRAPSVLRSYSRSRAANRLFGSPRAMGLRHRSRSQARGGAYSRSRTALNNLASVEAALKAMNQAKMTRGRTSMDPTAPPSARRTPVNVSQLLAAARTNLPGKTVKRTQVRPATPVRRPSIVTTPIAPTRARSLSSNRINLKPTLQISSREPTAESWFQRMFGRKRAAYRNILSKVRGHRNYSSRWWIPSPGFRPNRSRRGSRAAFR